MLCDVVSCEIVLCSVVFCCVLLCCVVSFWKHFLILLDTILITFLTFFSYLFLVTFLTFRGSKPKREPGEGGVDPAYKGIPALKLPP